MNPLSADWQTFFAVEINATAALTGLVGRCGVERSAAALYCAAAG
jgi:hypothetical protein